MFNKTTLVKCALVPLAAATVFSSLASASPAPATGGALQARGDTTPYTSPTSTWASTSSSYAPQKTEDCDCGFKWDKDHAPKITQPNKDTVWKVGTQQKVTWEVKWDGQKNGTSYGDGKDGKGWDDGKNGQQWGKDDGKDRKEEDCKTRLFLRKGDALPFLILAEGFDIKSGSVDVTVPNVFFGTDYSVVLSVGDKLQSNSEKFKIVKDDKDYSNFCKDGKDKDGKDCKDGKGGNNGVY